MAFWHTVKSRLKTFFVGIISAIGISMPLGVSSKLSSEHAHRILQETAIIEEAQSRGQEKLNEIIRRLELLEKEQAKKTKETPERFELKKAKSVSAMIDQIVAGVRRLLKVYDPKEAEFLEKESARVAEVLRRMQKEGINLEKEIEILMQTRELLAQERKIWLSNQVYLLFEKIDRMLEDINSGGGEALLKEAVKMIKIASERLEKLSDLGKPTSTEWRHIKDYKGKVQELQIALRDRVASSRAPPIDVSPLEEGLSLYDGMIEKKTGKPYEIPKNVQIVVKIYQGKIDEVKFSTKMHEHIQQTLEWCLREKVNLNGLGMKTPQEYTLNISAKKSKKT